MSAVTTESLRVAGAADTSGTTTVALPRTGVPDHPRGDGPARWTRGTSGALLALAVAQSVVVLDLDVPVLRAAVGLLTVLVLPTWVLHRRASWPTDSAVARCAYAFGASFLGVMIVGLAVNTAGPAVGVDRPLTPAVLGLTWLFLDAALLLWRRHVPLLEPDRAREVVRRAWAAPAEPAQVLALAALPMAVLGAIRLNNGAGGAVAITAHVLVVAAYAVLLCRRGAPGRDLRVLYLAALSLLLATSLRGWGITGHDVQAEYGVYTLTADAQHWSMDLLQNAYTACLSITILPVVLAEATGLSGTVWFKIGFQVVFALVPVLAYLVFRRFVARRLALVAAAFVIAFPTFHVDMPYLVRQEIAFLFLVLLLLAATDRAMPAKRRRVLVVVLGLGVVLSHYATTYLLLMALGAGLFLLGLTILVVRPGRSTRDGGALVLLRPTVLVLLAGSSLLWTGPATGTGGHPLTVAEEAIEALLGDQEGETAGSNDRRFLLFAGREDSAEDRLARFVDETMEAREAYPRRLALFKDPGSALTEPEIVDPEQAPHGPVGGVLDAVGVDPGAVVVGLRGASAALLQVLLLAGLWWLARAAVRRRRGTEPSDVVGEDGRPPVSRVSTEVVCVLLGVMAALGLVAVVPSLSVEYGVLRAFLQSLVFVAPAGAVGLWWLLSRLGRERTGWMVVVPVALLAVLTSAGTALVGGGPAKLALANAGTYHERYIVEDSDVAAVQRLERLPDDSGPLPKVLTPTNHGVRLALAGVPREEIHGRTFPTLLNVGSYLFADSRLTADREDTLFLDGDRVTYRYPLRRIDQRMHLVYSAGDSRIYR